MVVLSLSYFKGLTMYIYYTRILYCHCELEYYINILYYKPMLHITVI